MADFTKLHETIAALSAKVDELLAKPAPDDQPEVDKAEAEAAAIIAKLL